MALVDEPAHCSPSGASATTRPDSRCCWQLLADARRRRGGTDPGRDRNRRGLLVAGLRAAGAGVRDQPDGRVPLPRPTLGRRARSPTPATRWCSRTSCAPTGRAPARCPPIPSWPQRSRCSPAPSRTRSGTAPARQQAALAAARVLPGLPGRVREKRDLRPEARAVLGRPHPGRRPPRLRKTQLRGPAPTRRPQARHRRRADPDPWPRCAPSSYTSRPWSKTRMAGKPWPCCEPRHRMRQLPTTGRRRDDPVRPAPRRRHHHQLARPRHRHRRPAARRDRRRPRPLRRRPRPQGLRRSSTGHPGQRQKPTVIHRAVKNQRLATVGYLWAFSALTASPGARAHYDRRKAAGDRHIAAQRNLFNRMLGMLHHCLTTGQPYNEAKAFPAMVTATSGKPSAVDAHQESEAPTTEAVRPDTYPQTADVSRATPRHRD